MLRIILLAAAVLALAGSASSIRSFDQEGTSAAPRAPIADGQPLETKARIQVHGGTVVGSTIEPGAGERVDPDASNQQAVSRRHAGAALQVRGGGGLDFQFDVDGAWSPTATTVSGGAIDAPDAAVVSVTTGARLASPISDDVRLGVAIDIGGTSMPIRRSDSGDVERAVAFVGRMALVPSYRSGIVTVFGTAGLTTETEVPPTVTWDELEESDPGVTAGVSGMAMVVGAGATVDAGNGARITARIGDTFSDHVRGGRYGTQVDVGLSFDLGK